MERTTPDSGRRLADGAVVEASVVARVLGVRLLTIEATVVLVPAAIRPLSAAAGDPATRTPARSSRVSSMPANPAGRRLAEAVRSVNEGAELLAEARRSDSTRVHKPA